MAFCFRRTSWCSILFLLQASLMPLHSALDKDKVALTTSGLLLAFEAGSMWPDSHMVEEEHKMAQFHMIVPEAGMSQRATAAKSSCCCHSSVSGLSSSRSSNHKMLTLTPHARVTDEMEPDLVQRPHYEIWEYC